MQGMDTTCKGSGLEYHYLMVRDEYLDERTQCGVWILDGNYQWKRDLLKFALNADNFADTTVLLLVSMTKPWDIMNSLQHWVDVLEAHIKTLNLDPKVLENFREQSKFFKLLFCNFFRYRDETHSCYRPRLTKAFGFLVDYTLLLNFKSR